MRYAYWRRELLSRKLYEYIFQVELCISVLNLRDKAYKGLSAKFPFAKIVRFVQEIIISEVIIKKCGRLGTLAVIFSNAGMRCD